MTAALVTEIAATDFPHIGPFSGPVQYAPPLDLPNGGTTAVLLVQGNPLSWMSGAPRSHHTLLLDLATGKETVWSEKHERLSISPDGTRVAEIAEENAFPFARLRVWDTRSHQCLSEIKLHPARFNFGGSGESLSWSPNGKWLTWVYDCDQGGQGQMQEMDRALEMIPRMVPRSGR